MWVAKGDAYLSFQCTTILQTALRTIGLLHTSFISFSFYHPVVKFAYFVHVLLTNGTPFTHLFKNFASLLSAVMHLLKALSFEYEYPASKLSGALWRRGGKRKDSLQLRLWNLNSTSTFPVAPRPLSC